MRVSIASPEVCEGCEGWELWLWRAPDATKHTNILVTIAGTAICPDETQVYQVNHMTYSSFIIHACMLRIGRVTH